MSRLYKFLDNPDFFAKLANSGLLILGDREKHGFSCTENNKKLFSFRLPLSYPAPLDGQAFFEYLNTVQLTDEEGFIILLMEAGRAAVGLYKGDKLIDHKNIRKYMVRKKQGKAQISHLKSKGKSRYGSRLRLRESEAFFDEILEKLFSENYESIPNIYYHCPVRLKACLNEAAEDLKLDLNQFTWKRLATDIKECSFNEFKRVSSEHHYCRFLLENEHSKIPSIPEYKKL